MHPEKMTRIVDRKRYSTETATLIADDEYWDGHNWERRGRNTLEPRVTFEKAFHDVEVKDA